MRKIVAIAAAFAALTVLSDDGGSLPAVSFSASADVETAYICRGYVWDSRPYSAQEASAEVGFGPFGSVAAFGAFS